MILRIMMAAGLAGGVAAGACFPVTAARITGRDLALADPAFSALPATYTVGVAPEPGTPRRFAAAELGRIAAQNHISAAAPAELCFEIPMRELKGSDLEAAMRKSLGADAEFRIVESSKVAAPAGEIEFPLAGLEPAGPGSDGVQMWRGFVRYADTRKAPVWARVAITEHYTCVVAARDLAANSVVSAESVRLEQRTGAPPRDKVLTRIEDVAGRQVTRVINSGDPIAASLLIAPWDVKRGDAIRVEVQSGEAHVNLDAIAEGSARRGDMVDLRNPVSGKMFRARVERSGRAVLVLAGGPGL